MEYKNILIDRQGPIATVTLNRPPANAFNVDLVAELDRFLNEVENEKQVRVIVITGQGHSVFSAGADIKQFPTGGLGNTREQLKIFGLGCDLTNRIETYPKPVIAAVNGVCLGGGNELAMACDIRIAAKSARFGQPEINIGIVPAWGGIHRLGRLIGRGKAQELLLTGEMIAADEALALGLVTRVVPDEELMSSAKALAQKLAQQAPLAIALTKKRAAEGMDTPLVISMREDVEGCIDLFKTRDTTEGLQAFKEKRRPAYIGE